jgi:3',5'-cyclic AMP phosphodiesterase CpdA
MLRLLHISDLHFGPPYMERVGEAVQRLAPELNPDIIVASGDFTQRAKTAQFAQAKEFLGRLPDVPKVAIPGNHDVPLYRVAERVRDPHGLYRQYISNELDRTWHFDEATIVGIDSTAPRRAISNGRIQAAQLDFCAEAFASSPNGAAKIVVAHHHFTPAPDHERDQTMPKAKRAMKRFVEMGVDMILGGHLHRSYIGDSLDFYPSLRSGHQGIIIVQCGTTTSRRGRERERNSLNAIEITPDTLHVTHHMYFGDTGCFEPISNHDFPRRGRRILNGPRPHDG